MLSAVDTLLDQQGDRHDKRKYDNVLSVLFYAITILAAISCLSRADYNLPLFAILQFIFFDYLPAERRKKVVTWFCWLIAASCVQDTIWILFWSYEWFSESWMTIAPHTKSIHITVVVTSLLELLLKIVVCIVFQIMPDGVDYSVLVEKAKLLVNENEEENVPQA